MKNILKNWEIFILIISIVAISSALVAEYFFNLTPCKMCLKQRHPYYAIISIVILFYIIGKPKNIFLHITNQIAVIYGLFYSIWHMGIEKGLLNSTSSCSGTLQKTNSIQNLKDQIINQEVINCNEVVWSIFGLSAATINSLLLLSIFIFNSIYILNSFYDSKKN